MSSGFNCQALPLTRRGEGGGGSDSGGVMSAGYVRQSDDLL